MGDVWGLPPTPGRSSRGLAGFSVGAGGRDGVVPSPPHSLKDGRGRATKTRRRKGGTKGEGRGMAVRTMRQPAKVQGIEKAATAMRSLLAGTAGLRLVYRRLIWD